jgi:RimJ/RimL family protein N-acetyltransferase
VDPLTDPPAENLAAGPPLLATARLLLRTWTDADADALYALSNDRETMVYFPDLPSREQIDGLVARHRANLARGRPGLFAVEVRAGQPLSGAFIGFVGLAEPTWQAAFTPCVEIGWRLQKRAWGHGYATEAARAVLRHAFSTLALDEVVSFTAVANEPSRAVMRRIGMRHFPDEDFDHPNVVAGHPLRRHVLYRISAADWARHQLDAALD